MELILSQLEVENNKLEDEDDDEDDEVSFVYYGEHCNCTKNSMCKSKKCLCFLRGEKCSSKCHQDFKTKCTNK